MLTDLKMVDTVRYALEEVIGPYEKCCKLSSALQQAAARMQDAVLMTDELQGWNDHVDKMSIETRERTVKLDKSMTASIMKLNKARISLVSVSKSLDIESPMYSMCTRVFNQSDWKKASPESLELLRKEVTLFCRELLEIPKGAGSGSGDAKRHSEGHGLAREVSLPTKRPVHLPGIKSPKASTAVSTLVHDDSTTSRGLALEELVAASSPRSVGPAGGLASPLRSRANTNEPAWLEASSQAFVVDLRVGLARRDMLLELRQLLERTIDTLRRMLECGRKLRKVKSAAYMLRFEKALAELLMKREECLARLRVLRSRLHSVTPDSPHLTLIDILLEAVSTSDSTVDEELLKAMTSDVKHAVSKIDAEAKAMLREVKAISGSSKSGLTSAVNDHDKSEGALARLGSIEDGLCSPSPPTEKRAGLALRPVRPRVASNDSLGSPSSTMAAIANSTVDPRIARGLAVSLKGLAVG